MNQQLKDYILANHQQMTCGEMAKGYSEQSGAETTSRQVEYVLTYLELKAVRPADKIRAYIREHQHLSALQIASKLGYGANAIRKHAKGMGIVLPPSPMGKVRKSDEMPTGGNAGHKKAPAIKPRKRFSEPYTQSGSPFKIADEIRNLKIK